MYPINTKPAGVTIYEQLDQMPMCADDRARAKASLEKMELMVDLVFDAWTWIRTSAASAARRIRTSLIAKPQH
jgi:hypothetical protein